LYKASILTLNGAQLCVIPIEGQKQAFLELDYLATAYYSATSHFEKNSIFEQMREIATPVIHNYIAKHTSHDMYIEERADIIATMSVDFWKLVNNWIPKTNPNSSSGDPYKFHYIFLKHMHDKLQNAVKFQSSCHKRAIRVDIDDPAVFDTLYADDTGNILDSLSSTDFVTKLVNKIDDDTTKDLIKLLALENADIQDSQKFTQLKPRAIRRRRERCRPLIIELLTNVPYDVFLEDFYARQNIDSRESKDILYHYCIGCETNEIKKRLKLSTKIVQECLDKYKKSLITTLLNY